ncbi:MAG: DNA topoisomerase I [Candidatus Micrarchaeota archaeon]|nr:DNA topoisomerase I [Candidatus Micrarchaeota archaeon]
MKILVIAEKPSVGARIAAALGEGRERRVQSKSRVGYYEIPRKDGTMYVVSAAGHLYTIKQADSARGYPVLNVTWAPSYEVGDKSAHTKDYLDVITKLASECQLFINACDFDTEGTVIGTNIIRFAAGDQNGDKSKRMKFSTTTDHDLKEAYSKLMQLDLNNYYAGEARHMLDWLWGINLSRALTQAVSGYSMRNPLSIGRVQGPTLAILAKREKEIAAFVPKPFWRIKAMVKNTEFLNAKGDMFDKAAAQASFDNLKRNAKGTIESVETTTRSVAPYPPFDLTSLQLEASRALHYDPSRTLAIAQSLYEKALISYPRTSSQKLPSTLGLPSILAELAKDPEYSAIARSLIAAKRFRPVEGPKTDEAHPAIFPTGERPRGLTDEEEKLYDLVTRRFLAVFAPNAEVSRVGVTAVFGDDRYKASGQRVTSNGWLDVYGYARIEDREIPEFRNGEQVTATKPAMEELQTTPPKRYAKAGLIAELEKRNLGTKATRASTIDTLFRRNYIEGTSIMVTKFGMSVYDTLDKNCNMIVEDNTTKRLEVDMEEIVSGLKSESDVVEEGKQMLLDALKAFDEHKEQISASLREAQKESSIIGKCPKDGGDLRIIRSRAGKYFVGCSNYPKCTQTYSLPQNAKIIATGNTCEHCHTPIIKVIRARMRPFEMDLDPNCITKKDWKSASDQQESRVEIAVPSSTLPKGEGGLSIKAKISAVKEKITKSKAKAAKPKAAVKKARKRKEKQNDE